MKLKTITKTVTQITWDTDAEYLQLDYILSDFIDNDTKFSELSEKDKDLFVAFFQEFQLDMA